MWDRQSYEDTDYGLEPGESFEPEDVDEDDLIDLSLPHIMTVLGPISPEELGVCLHHEHVLCDPIAVTQHEPDYRLDNLTNAQIDLEAYLTVGGRGIVDCSPRDYGRDIDGLLLLAQRVPAHIIAVTGRHKDLHASRMANALDIDALGAEYTAELQSGAGELRARPGVIKFGTSLDEITPVEEAAVRAAARASIATGTPITTHTEAGTQALQQLELLGEEGVDPGRVIIGHLDRKLEWDYLVEVLQTGAFVSFDQIGKPQYGVDEDKAAMIVRLAEAGFGEQLLISQDFARKSLLMSYGGSPGPTYLMEQFTLMLMEAGASALFVRTLLVDNVARALTIRSR
ncbi:MAG: phosphotriesterase family protein [Thermomicrobiales bacterium]